MLSGRSGLSLDGGRTELFSEAPEKAGTSPKCEEVQGRRLTWVTFALLRETTLPTPDPYPHTPKACPRTLRS